jgi:hypothetical protein
MDDSNWERRKDARRGKETMDDLKWERRKEFKRMKGKNG